MLERFDLRLCGVAIGALALCGALAGCGNSVGNRLSGNVVFDGKPVPAGKVYIMPDSSMGNEGHTGFADIKDGKYDTSAEGGRGAPSGPVVIAVEGIDPNAASGSAGGEDVVAKLLFARYEIKAELPEGESTKDIEVPKEAEKSNVAPERFVPNDV